MKRDRTRKFAIVIKEVVRIILKIIEILTAQRNH